jgi:hypothetical protein
VVGIRVTGARSWAKRSDPGGPGRSATGRLGLAWDLRTENRRDRNLGPGNEPAVGVLPQRIGERGSGVDLEVCLGREGVEDPEGCVIRTDAEPHQGPRFVVGERNGVRMPGKRVGRSGVA